MIDCVSESVVVLCLHRNLRLSSGREHHCRDDEDDKRKGNETENRNDMSCTVEWTHSIPGPTLRANPSSDPTDRLFRL